MRRPFIYLVVATAGIFGAVACGPTSTTVNVNSNRSIANSAGSTVNTVANSAGNAVNSVSNTISNMTNSSSASSADDFMTEAAQGGMAEVQLGKLAASKAKDPEVKKFGQMMVDDHTKANNELKTVAAKKNFTLPADIGSHKSTLDELTGLSGADFDKEYVEEMVDDHETDVAAFQKQADNGTDPDVKAFAAKTLPVLKKHLEAIKAITG